MKARNIERATIATWPAAITEHHHGWVYLAAGGITGRVNAVWPLDWEGGSLDGAITHVERWYEAHQLPPRFKLTDDAFAPSNLADALAARGYEPTSPTLVMTAPITRSAEDRTISLTDVMPARFEAALAAASKNEAEFAERRAIALRAPQPAAFAMIGSEDAPASIGMCAAAGALAGIFLMRTITSARRQGHSRRILGALLARAADWGARTAFLQVDADNVPAIALYEGAGFTTLTTYHFWRKPA